MTRAKYLGTGGHKVKSNYFEPVNLIGNDDFKFVQSINPTDDELDIYLNNRYFGTIEFDDFNENLASDNDIDVLSECGHVTINTAYINLNQCKTFILIGEELRA